MVALPLSLVSHERTLRALLIRAALTKALETAIKDENIENSKDNAKLDHAPQIRTENKKLVKYLNFLLEKTWRN